jgi:hypothetical protein
MRKTLLALLIVILVLPGFSKTPTTLKDIYQPESLTVKGDFFYIVHKCTIMRFSLKEHKFLNRFGKRGEGPGEFKYPPLIHVTDEHIFANSVGKIIYFTHAGTLITEIRIPYQSDLWPLKRNYLFHKFNTEKRTANLMVRVIGPTFNAIKDLGAITPSHFLYIGEGDETKRDRNLIPHYSWAFSNGETVILGRSVKGFHIELYDHLGNPLHIISKEYEKIKIPQKVKDEKMAKEKKSKYWEQNKRMFNYVFPKHYPAIFRIFATKDKLYVFTHKTEKDRREVIVLDFKGNILGKTFVPQKSKYFITGGKYYYLNENPDEDWELRVVDIN